MAGEHSVPTLVSAPSERVAVPNRVLDVGCGDGRSLVASGLTICNLVVGVDVHLESIRRAARRIPEGMFVLARAEELPFSEGSFDRVISRVALPYMDIPKAVKEIVRVLAPGGSLNVTLHSFGFAISDLARRVRGRKPKPVVGSIWVLVNGVLFNLFLRGFRMPFSRNIETWQTSWAMRRLLRRLGISGPIKAPVMIGASKVRLLSELD